MILRTYKGAVTTACRRSGRYDFAWQRGYYEHVIRTEDELSRTREYIINNPAQWELDEHNPNICR